MKQAIAILTFLLLIFSSCSKKGIDPKTGLPAATQTGANTFGAYVNGAVYIPASYFGSFSQELYMYYTSTPPKGDTINLIFNTNDYVNKGGSFRFLAHGALSQGQSYSLQTSSANIISVTYLSDSQVEYKVIPPLTGQFTVTKLDLQKFILSGTFYFDAVNSTGDKVSVTDGRFDVTF